VPLLVDTRGHANSFVRFLAMLDVDPQAAESRLVSQYDLACFVDDSRHLTLPSIRLAGCTAVRLHEFRNALLLHASVLDLADGLQNRVW